MVLDIRDPKNLNRKLLERTNSAIEINMHKSIAFLYTNNKQKKMRDHGHTPCHHRPTENKIHVNEQQRSKGNLQWKL